MGYIIVNKNKSLFNNEKIYIIISKYNVLVKKSYLHISRPFYSISLWKFSANL